MRNSCIFLLLFFFNDTATTEIYTLSLHDALPISVYIAMAILGGSIVANFLLIPVLGIYALPTVTSAGAWLNFLLLFAIDRKSTRLNSSYANISYAVFCLKKKKNSRYHCCTPVPTI